MEKANACAEVLRKQIKETENQLKILREQLAQVEARELDVEIEKLEIDSPVTRKWPLEGEEYRRYGRQMIVPGFGIEGLFSLFIFGGGKGNFGEWNGECSKSETDICLGQLRLKAAKVLIVGAGGLGCPAAAYLAGAGVGTIGIVDGDEVEVSNLHRQVLHSTERVGWKKVDSAISALKQYFYLPLSPFASIFPLFIFTLEKEEN